MNDETRVMSCPGCGADISECHVGRRRYVCGSSDADDGTAFDESPKCATKRLRRRHRELVSELSDAVAACRSALDDLNEGVHPPRHPPAVGGRDRQSRCPK